MDFIIVNDRNNRPMLGITRAVLDQCSDFDIELEVLDYEVYSGWGSEIDECPIDEEFRYRWQYLGDYTVPEVVAQVNAVRSALAIARQEYLDEFGREIIKL